MLCTVHYLKLSNDQIAVKLSLTTYALTFLLENFGFMSYIMCDGPEAKVQNPLLVTCIIY